MKNQLIVNGTAFNAAADFAKQLFAFVAAFGFGICDFIAFKSLLIFVIHRFECYF